MSDKVIAKLGLFCPDSNRPSDFYICEGKPTEFLGCCASDPCANDGKCPKDDLRQSAFNPAKYKDIPPQECDQSSENDRDQLFYTCSNEKNKSTAFMGCCSVNACQAPRGVCPEDKLGPTILNRNSTKAENFMSTDSGGSSGLSTGAIVGIVIGSVVAIGAILVIMWRCGWHARKRKERESNVPQTAQHEMSFAATPHNHFPYDPRASHAPTATPLSYDGNSPVSLYYNMKRPGSPNIPDERHMSTYTDSNVSTLSGYSPRLPSHHPGGGMNNLHPVSELDSIHVEQRPPVPPVELGAEPTTYRDR